MKPLGKARLRFLLGLALGGLLLVVALSQAAPIVGPTYPIAEEDAIEMFQRLLREKEASGELAEALKRYETDTKNLLLQPKPINLPTATANATRYYDPSYVLQKDIPNGQGGFLYRAGTSVNPLQWVNFSQHWLFLDGSSPDQMALANTLNRRYEGRIKLILTKGRPIDAMKEHKLYFFFDQGAVFTQKLGIKTVPSLVSQEGLVLRIDEIAPPFPTK